MSISYVGAANVWNDEGSGTAFTFNKPPAAIEGDLLIGVFQTCVSSPSAAAPTGWTLVSRVNETTTQPRVLLVAKRTVLAGDPNSWTNGVCATATGRGSIVVAYRGAKDAALQFVDSDTTANNTTATSLTTTAVSNTVDGAWVVGAWSGRDTVAHAWKSTLAATSADQVIGRSRSLTGSTTFGSAAIFDSAGPVAIDAALTYIGRTYVDDSDHLTAESVAGRMAVTMIVSPADAAPRIPVAPVEIPQRLVNSLSRSHRVFSFVDVISPLRETLRLEATAGEIQVDRTADIRRRCTINCVDSTNSLLPDDDAVAGVLTPYGTEVRPYRGIIYGDGSYDVVPLGVFKLSKVSISDNPDGLQFGLEAYDLSRTIARDKFTSPYVLYSGTNVIDAIRNIVERTFPEQVYDVTDSNRVITVTRVYDTSDDPWAAITELAMSCGYDVFFDIQGRLVVAPPTDIDGLSEADYEYVEGPDCTMLDLSRVFTDEPGYNGVVVTGESPADNIEAVRAIAWDEDPSSATYHLGPYGEVPMFHQDSIIKTTQDAQDTANQILNNLLGFASQVSLTGITNPTFECGDIIKVQRQKSRVNSLFVLDAFNIPLGASGTQSLVLRSKASTDAASAGEVQAPFVPTSISQVGTTTQNSNPAGDVADNLSVGLPTGTTGGDVIVAAIYKAENSVHTLTPPTGWTLISTYTTTTNIAATMYYKVATDSEPSSYSWHMSGTGIWGVSLTSFRNVDNDDPIDVVNKTTYTTTTNITAPSITTTATEAAVITFRATKGSTTTEVTCTTADAGTELIDWGLDGGAGTRNGAVYVQLAKAAGTYAYSINAGTGTVTNSICYAVALRRDEG
jgi:hypothetical protein